MNEALMANLFGTFRLWHGNEDIRPRGRKTGGLVAYLMASDRRSAPRMKLADLLWGDRGDQQARDSLRQTLRELRTSRVGRAIDISRYEIGMSKDAIVSDSQRIEEFAKRGDGEALADLLSGIEGHYLDDLDDLSPGFDEWLQPERARQREWLFSTTLDCFARLDAHSSEAGRRLLVELERLDPLNEDVVRKRLHLDHAAGDVAALHRRYRRLSNDLSRELSVAPSRETRELFESLVSAKAAETAAHALVYELSAKPLVKAVDHTPPVVVVGPFHADGNRDVVRMTAVVTEAVYTSLGRSAECRVIPVEAGGSEDMPALLRPTMAAFTLRGSVRQVGSEIIVTAQFSNAETRFLIWAEQFRLAVSDPGGVDAVIERIVGAVGPGIEREFSTAFARSASEPSPDDAPSLYSCGKRLAREARTLDTVREGTALLERALAADPRHVGARLLLAQLHNTDFHYLMAGHDVAALRARALGLALEAAEIEPSSVRVQLRLAWCRLRQGDWDRAKQLFVAAEAAMAHDADAIDECGFGLAQLGELDAARELIQRAFRLNPFAPAEYHADFAVLQALAGDHVLAEAHFEVCGEQRLFWQVIRLSNLHRLDRSASQLLALQERFVRTLREIWVRPEPPELADVLAWSRTIFCFQRPEDRQLIVDGVSAAWLSFAPAGDGNSQ